MARKQSTTIIPWSTVSVGDKVRAHSKHLDVVRTMEGRVDFIVERGVKRSYYSQKGVLLFVTLVHERHVTVELLERPHEPQKDRLF